MSRAPSQQEILFAEALALPTAERGTFLARACGANVDLLAQLVALVAAHEGPQSLVMPVASSRDAISGEEKPGDTIVRYRLLQKIGEGGCGVVWMAEQDEPVRRRVALKVIKLGMDTKSVVARFEAERQALAMMDHPNIAKVHDGGATHTGRPFFVMELVRGIPITKYCDENHLTPAARLELFIKVCQAVQHAHQKGIIHRDLKPSNILVTANEGAPTPKVIDFGIAKATQGRLTDATVFTQFEQFIGTPVYMSPEQAEMSSLDIDTRSDIYSLGVLLYELLTGAPPFDPKKFAQAGVDQIRQQIREVQPPRPSVRLQTLDDDERTTVAQLRGTAAANLSLVLRGDLDWIVMRCIEKDRTRRYDTANGLAMDIERHLRHQPVVARPPSAVYIIQKLILRHRVGFAAAAFVLLAIIAGAMISTWQAIRATRAERTANRERVKAVESRTRADDLLDFMLGELRTELQKIGKLDVLDKVGDKATSYFGSLDSADLGDAALAQQARSLTQIGEIRLAQGRPSEAATAFSTVHDRAASLVERHPSRADYVFARAQAEYWIGHVYWKRGDFRATQEWWTRYRDTAAALVSLEPGVQKWQSELVSGLHNLAVLRLERREFDAAREDFMTKLATLQQMVAAKPDDLELQYRVSDT